MNYIISKLPEARSRLYRRRCLQVKNRYKALDEICKMNILLHRANFEISANVRSSFCIFPFFPRDVLEGKSEKTKIAWPKNAQPKMPHTRTTNNMFSLFLRNVSK